jgi:hypothetical protein
MLSDDAQLTKESNAKTLTVVLDTRKFRTWSTHAEPHVLLSIECTDPRASRELGLILLQWISRTSYQANVQKAFDLPSTKSKKRRKSR